MLILFQRTVYIFVFVFAITAILTVVGISYLWFGPSTRDGLPYLGWLITTLLAEVVAVVVLIAKRAMAYIPETLTTKNPAATANFMMGFIAQSSSVTVMTNRAGWLSESQPLLEQIKRRCQEGARVEVVTPRALPDSLRHQLAEAGVELVVTGEPMPPEARFTLVNGDRSGAARLAIARGAYPAHEILVFDSSSGPQIIGMAKDIIRKSKETARASQMV